MQPTRWIEDDGTFRTGVAELVEGEWKHVLSTQESDSSAEHSMSEDTDDEGGASLVGLENVLAFM